MTPDITSLLPSSRFKLLLFFACFINISGCSTLTDHVDTHENLNATLWTQTAAEYEASTRQAYSLARSNLELALADSTWTAALEQTGNYQHLPPAIMLDLDQTVLDNSAYNVFLIREGKKFSKTSYARWCQTLRATAVPGAKEFVDYARQHKVTVFYYSRRQEKLRDCTLKNLDKLGLGLRDSKRVLLNDGTSKTEYRSRVAKNYRILLLVGDNLEDFMDGYKSATTVRNQRAKQQEKRWGRQWIILPNPIYGDWESSLYGFDYSLPRSEMLDRKQQHLRE